MSLLDDIPGYRKAVEREATVRNAAFLDVNESICGIEVAPLSLRRFLMLDGLGSPFIEGGRVPTMNDCVQFMWAVSPQFNPQKKGLRRHIRKCKRVKHVPLVIGINVYMYEVLMDSPPMQENKGFSPPYYSWATSFVDKFASEYHWSERDVLDMPLKRLFQYVRLLSRKSDSKVILFNPSDKVRSAWMKQRRLEKEKETNVQ